MLSMSFATKSPRRLTKAQLTDAIGAAKAGIANAEAAVDTLKKEAIRRGIKAADGELFHITLTPPSESLRLDTKKMEIDFGIGFLAKYRVPVATDWTLRCTARTFG